MTLSPGKRCGPYWILAPIGAGGMGEVYRARDPKLQRDVAVKVLPELLAQDLDVRARFEREALAVAALSHPNILSIFDFGTHDGISYAVMELLDGETLRAKLIAGPIAQNQAVDYALQIARGILAAHKKGVVHRDLKPENLFVSHDGHLKILDFGLAKRFTAAGSGEGASDHLVSGLTSPGIVLGTAGYMSPEQVRGYSVDNRSDIFSLGAILYEMLSGKRAFKKETPADTMAAILKEAPPELSACGRNVSPALESIVRRCLEKSPLQRFQSADEIVRALQAAPTSGVEGAVRLTVNEQAQPAAFSSQASGLPSTARRAREAERRQITVLVCGCGLFESEAYLEQLDAEDQATLLRGFQETCERAASRLDGTVVQCDEQGALVCFGYPVAFEDGARRASHTALDLLDDLRAFGDGLRDGQGLLLNPWVGVHTGLAIVHGEPGSVSLVGEARNVATRLKDIAEPGQVICTESTHRLIRERFECASLGKQKIRGVAQPVEVFRIQGLGEARSPIEVSGPAELSPLTGRDHEISLLQDRWEQAREGRGQVVLLVGEPGLGKSRLVHAMKEHIRGQPGVAPSLSENTPVESDAHVVEWRCSRRLQNTGLYPAADFFERFLRFLPGETSASRFDRLAAHLGEYGLARPDVVPLFASLLSVPPDDRYPSLGLAPVREREETFRGLLEWLRAFSNRRPLLFILEDLHWGDASTLEFLGQFLAESLHERILTLITFRPEFQMPWPAAGQQTRLALTCLTRRQVGELMRKKTAGEVPESLIEQIYDRTGGVPFFVEEYTRMAQESGGLNPVAEGGAPTLTTLTREIPASLQDLVMARLDRMEGDREIAQIAAAIGREVSYELLAAVAPVDEPSLQIELAKLVKAEILYPQGRPPHGSYVFKHALLEDALYNALVKTRRQQFHSKIAEVLEAQFRATVDKQPELVAHHFTEAGVPEKAIDYWLKAGLRSRERSAEIEAIGHLTRGLTLLQDLKESPERDAREFELLGPLGTAYIASRGYAAPEVGPVFRRARELCERVAQPAQLFALMLGIWEWHTVRGDLRLCGELASEGLDFARRHNDPGILMEALFMVGETMLYRADFTGARDRFATAVEKYDDRERTRLWAAHTSHNAGVTHRSNLAVSLWHLGYPDLAQNVNLETRQLAREIGHPYSLAYALHHTGWLYQCCRLGSQVRAAAEEEIKIAFDQGFALWQATGTFFRGAAMLLEGDPKEALPVLVKGLDAFRAGGAELTLPFQLATLGEAYMRVGQFAEARRILDEGLAIADKNDERCHQAELHRLAGELLLADSGADEAAESRFREAIEIARRQGSKAWELRATTSLARLCQRRGRLDEAREALAAIYGGYTEGFATPDLVAAAALMEALG